MDCDYAVVVLKGMIEKNDAGAYFGSTATLLSWVKEARNRGWVEGEGPTLVVSEAGYTYYKKAGLDSLPKTGRGYMWDWSTQADWQAFPLDPKETP